jgi:hypothetical protein
MKFTAESAEDAEKSLEKNSARLSGHLSLANRFWGRIVLL